MWTLLDKDCPVALRDPKPCLYVHRGRRTHPFEQLRMPGAGPGTLCRCPLYSSLTCSFFCNMGIIAVPDSWDSGNGKVS